MVRAAARARRRAVRRAHRRPGRRRLAARSRRPRRLPELRWRGRLPGVAVHARRDGDRVHRRRPLRLLDVVLRPAGPGAQAQPDHRQARPINAPVSVDNRTASPSPPTARTSTPPTAGVVTFNRDPATGAITQAGVTDGGLKHPRLATHAMGIDISPDGKFVYAVSARSTRSSSSRATSRPARSPACRPAGLRQRARPTRRGRPATANTCTAAPAMLGIIDIRVGPGGTQLYTVSDQKDSIAVLTRDATTGSSLRRPATRSASHLAASGTGRRTTTRFLNEKSFDCKAGQPELGVPQRHLVLARRRQRLRRRPARHGLLHAQHHHRRADAGRGQGRLQHLLRDPAAPARTRRTRSTPAASWVRPDGKRAYAAVGESAGVMTWERNTTTGGADPAEREAGCTAMQSFGVRYYHACAPARHLAGAWFGIGSPDGRHFYAGSLYDRELISFAIVRTSFTPGPVDFFVQEVGQTAAAKTTTVRNEGTDPMPIAASRSAARTRRATRSREHVHRDARPGRDLQRQRDVHADARRTSTRRSTSPPAAARRARTRRR